MNGESAGADSRASSLRELRGYRRDDNGTHPAYLTPEYRSTERRAPDKPLILFPHTLSEITGPVYGHDRVGPLDHDLTRQHEGDPLGERIIVTGRVLDGDGRPVRNSLVEIWQCNAAGRYIHRADQHPAPLDPNFTGAGRAMTDDEGRYRFITIKPGAYPWGNHDNAWRPAHIHFSLFGRSFTQRLITQMYVPGDPLFPFDPILSSVPEAARERLVSRLDMDLTTPEWALGYRWDIVLRGREATPRDDEEDEP
jgi:protocatechuate 3,4-dioxygenase beta subunit